jgi:4-hydroxy-tetrahydrodipicolinate reductase
MQTAVLYSPNITLGINFLIAASKVLQRIAPNADIEIVEEHFRDKKDVSGTALRIAEDLGLDKNRCVNSIRVGGIVGKHEVIFGLPYQTIRLEHESISRAAFGQGAIYAAKWLMKKEKGLYNMEEALSINLV